MNKEYPSGCPKCKKYDANAEYHAEDQWMWQFWICHNCGFKWTEQFEFQYWEATDE